MSSPLVSLVGRVAGDEGEGPIVADARMIVDGRRHRRTRGDGFTLELGDGRSVRVDVNPERVDAHPDRVRTDRWGDLADSPLAAQVALLDEVAPGDHVEVELGGWAVLAGQRVAVRGAVTDGTPERPGRIRADRLAVVDADDRDGAEAVATLEEAERTRQAEQAAATVRDQAARREPPRPPRPPSPRAPWRIAGPVLMVLTLGWGVAAALTWDDPRVLMAAGKPLYGLGILIVAIYLATCVLAYRIALPPFDRGGPGSENKFHPAWGLGKAMFLFGLVSGAAGLPVVAVGVVGGTAFGAAILFGVVALWSLVLVAYLTWRRRRELRLARLVLRAPRQPTPLADRGSGWFAGVIAPGSRPELSRTVRYYRRSSTRNVTTTDSNGNVVTRQETTTWIDGEAGERTRGRLEVACGDQTITVDVSGAVWGAPISYSATPGDATAVSHASIGTGDEVVVVGRVRARDDGALTVRSTGPESLILFGAPAPARSTLAGATYLWLGQAALLALFGLACATASVWLARLDVPRVHAREPAAPSATPSGGPAEAP